MTTCTDPDHYPTPEPPNELTADPRLHVGEGCGQENRLAVKKYRTIVVDPPWRFDQAWLQAGSNYLFSNARRPGITPPPKSVGRGAAAHYGVMTQDDLAAMPINDWAEDKAHLYLWTTNQFMRDAHDLMAVWGFKQKTILTWVKPKLGLGRYYRNCTEHVLFGARGNLAVLRRDVRNVFAAPQSRHSEKPAAFYDMVESMSPGPYLDVFARKHRFGWDVYGNEVYSDIPLVEPKRLVT